jgi:hypothetical protein
LPEKLTFKYKGTEDKPWDLNDPKSTYLLISRGNLEGGDLTYHVEKSPSSAAVNFASTVPVGAVTETWLVQIHGVCMILAWMAAAASGMLMAR